jgi:glycosyltransferase involved in cell wall biosynthesis
MNILAIPTTYGLSKPISGGQNRVFNIVKELRKRENKIVVLESDSLADPNDIKIANIYSYKDYKIFNRTLTVFRDINIYFISKLLHILKNERIDLIQITHPSGILVTKVIVKLTGDKIPIIYDAHNVESDFIKETFVDNAKYSKVERLLVPLYIKLSEKIVFKYAVDHITSVSDKERDIFIKRYGVNREKVSVIPSGCTILNLPDKKCKSDLKKEIGINPDTIIIFFHGLFTHPPNKDAFKIIEHYIAPKFRKINERVLFVIGGTDAPKFERTNIKSLGFIKNLYKVMLAADMAIVPLRKGAGTKLKVLDYLGVCLPIVTTKKGIDGIDAKNYEHAIIVDDINEEFINAIKYLIDNEEERNRMGINARKLAEERYDWNKIGDKLDKLYRGILEEKKHANK